MARKPANHVGGEPKKKRGFLDGYKTYDTSTGYGSVDQWRAAFEGMTEGEAKAIIGTTSPHAILGLDRSQPITDDMVKKAYRLKARQTHPDAGGDADEFKKVHAAYVALGGKD